MGRQRTPTRTKELAGTIRSDRVNHDEPQPEPLIPDPPEYVKGAALTEWNRITPELDAQKIVSLLDLAVLASYCCAYGEMEDATQEWQSLGSPMTTKSGNAVEMVHPLVTIISQRREQVRKFANELGASPAGRSKVKAQKTPDAKPKSTERFFK